MKYYISAFWKILTSWYVYAALFLDIISFLILSFSGLQIPHFIYGIIFGVGFLMSCVITVGNLLRELDNSNPCVISDDNLSLGGPNLSIDSISLINIGGGKARVTNISSDKIGKIRIIDDHYMESFLMEPQSIPHHIMINESKIIKGLGTTFAESSSIVKNWHKPFFIYVWYETMTSKDKFCTRIAFRSGEKFIRNMGWKQIKVN